MQQEEAQHVPPTKTPPPKGRRKSERTSKKTQQWDPTVQSTNQIATAVTQEVQKQTECIICDLPVTDDCMALECIDCLIWIHVGCDHTLTPTVYKQHQGDNNLPY